MTDTQTLFKRVKVYSATDVDKELEQFHNGNINEEEMMVFLNEEGLTLREPADNVQSILEQFCDNLSSPDSDVKIKFLTLRYWDPDPWFIKLTQYIALYCKQLKILKLIDCGLESKHMIEIATFFNNETNCKCKLSHIDFSRNDIDSKGIINGFSSIIEYHSQTLQHCYLNCNNMATKGLLALSKSLSLCTYIQGVDIVGQYYENTEDQDEDYEISTGYCLISSLMNKRELTTLCLDCNKIAGDDENRTSDLFPEFIISCPKLSCLTMGGCGLTFRDYEKLFNAYIQRGILSFKNIQNLAINVFELTDLPQGIWGIICQYFYEYIDKEKVRLFLYGNDMNKKVYDLICETIQSQYFSVDELDIHGSLNNLLKYEQVAKIGNILRDCCKNRIRQITFDCGGHINGKSLEDDWIDKLRDEGQPYYYTTGNPNGTRACFKRISKKPTKQDK